MSTSAPSILSSDLAVTGSITCDNEIQVEGMVEGDIKAGSITIGEKSVVKGEIVADSIVIRGKVIGKLRGRQVQLASSAHIEGDITHAQLSMESGAFFEGQCRHTSDPSSNGNKKATRQQSGTASTTTHARVRPPHMGTGKTK